MSLHEFVYIIAPPLTVSCSPILIFLGVLKAWQRLSVYKDMSVPCWAEGSD
jgi:hypothetical protein